MVVKLQQAHSRLLFQRLIQEHILINIYILDSQELKEPAKSVCVIFVKILTSHETQQV